MLQINPASTFPITRIITNHLETDTLYVRAVIKDAVNDTILETVDLDDKGSYYYRTNWKVVWDNVMARGRYITITTSVYTTNSYTTKSPNYGDELQIYVVQERWDSSKIIGGGYNGITTKDVKKVIKKELENIKFPKAKDIKFPKQTEYEANFKDITKELDKIRTLVGTLPAQNNDLSPVISRLNELSKDVKTKPVTPITDLKPILKIIKEIRGESVENKKEANKLLNILEKKLTTAIDEITKTAVKKTVPDIIQREVKIKERKSNLNKLKVKYGL